MVNQSSARLDVVFGALADPTRRAMLGALSSRPSTVGALAAPFDISLAAASKHIKVLERAGLVRRTVRGRVHHCALDARPLHAGFEWIRHYEAWWNRKLDVLEELLQQEVANEASRVKTVLKRPASKPVASNRKPKRSKP